MTSYPSFVDVQPNGREIWRVGDFSLMRGVHPASDCFEDSCFVHRPSEHKMRDWPITGITGTGGVVMRLCEHAAEHPDPDSLAFFENRGLSFDHACDNCCR